MLSLVMVIATPNLAVAIHLRFRIWGSEFRVWGLGFSCNAQQTLDP